MPCELWASVLQGDGGVAANRLMTVPANGVPIVSNFYDAKSRRLKKAAFAGLGKGERRGEGASENGRYHAFRKWC